MPQSEWSNHGPMRPPGIDVLVALEDNTLLVMGDPTDIGELRSLLRKLDLPVPTVECTLSVVSGKRTVLTTSTTGKAGTTLQAASTLSGPPTKAAQVAATFTILPLGVGRYELKVQGSVSVPLTAKGSRLTKTFQSTQELSLGQTITLDRTELGGEPVQLQLTLKKPITN